jgi:hypothetical protein
VKRILLIIILIFSTIQIFSQERPLNTGLSLEEQQAFIGSMSDIIERYGPPRSVAVARGTELWQDDVVFRYTGVDFYVFRDRVWQVRFNTTHSISNGDRKDVVLLTLGETVVDMGEFVLLQIDGKDWELVLRVNFNDNQIVNAIYLYHPYFQ